MKTIKVKNDFFSAKDTLECGQIFRYKPYKNGYLVFSRDRCAFIYLEGDFTIIMVNDEDEEYFFHFFDLDNDYSKIYNSAIDKKFEILTKSAMVGKGIRLLNQDLVETAFSFIISQNNNIPRIKGIIEKLCQNYGEKKTFMGEEYYGFFTPQNLANASAEDLKKTGLGYRAPYLLNFAKSILNGLNLEDYKSLDYKDLKKALVKIYGIGPKVADCIVLFGYKQTSAFPVDTWIEKVYRENFNGKLKSREQIADYFTKEFKENAGYFQQYLFHFKRNIDK